MRKKYEPRVMIATALWAISLAAMTIGIVFEWEVWRVVALQTALAASCASLAATAHRSTRLIVHVVALYRGDDAAVSSSLHRRRAETMMSPDGSSPPSSDGSGPIGKLFERD